MLKIGIPIGMGKTQFQINRTYVNYIANAGYDPVLITPSTSITAIAEYCDGLLLPGGIDLDPVFYFEDNLASHCVSPTKDNFERECFYAFINQSKPIFAICRGFQLIAREFIRKGLAGSSYLRYWQHIKDHRNTVELDVDRDVRTHSISLRTDRLYGVEGKEPEIDFVNSIHHQGLILRVPKASDFLKPVRQFVPLACTKLGLPNKTSGYVVEAFSIKGWNKAPIRAVQWHPEELNDIALLKYFFENNKQGASNYVMKKEIPNEKHQIPKMAHNNKKD